MSANLVRNQARNRQPIQGTGIRHGHRIAKGLVFATTGAAGFYDFVSGTFPNSVSGATVGVAKGGRTAKPAASSGRISWPAGTTGLDKITGAGTVLICFRSNNNAENWRTFGSREENTTGDGIYLLYDDSANVTNGFNVGANNNNYRVSSNSNVLGTNSEQSFHTFGMSWNTGNEAWLWADGKLDKYATGIALTPNTNTGRITRMESRTAQSDFLFAYAWNRVLTAAEIADITANPWQIFTAANQSLYADVIGGGGSGNAAPGGVAATASIGSCFATGNAAVLPSGVSAASGIGAAVAIGAANVSLSGVSAVSSIGTVTATGGGSSSATPAGVSTAASIGAAIATGSAYVMASGVSATASVGLVVASSSSNGVGSPSGAQASASIGSVQATGSALASVVGVSATIYVGSAYASGSDIASIPSSRVLSVPPESRVYAVTAECRVLIIQEAA